MVSRHSGGPNYEFICDLLVLRVDLSPGSVAFMAFRRGAPSGLYSMRIDLLWFSRSVMAQVIRENTMVARRVAVDDL